MSVIGLIVSLIRLLMRTRSFQALAESTTLRGTVGATSHSCGRSAQNWTQPIGGRACSPVIMNANSVAACACGEATVRAAASHPCLSIRQYPDLICDPSRLLGVTFLTKILRCR